MHDTPVYRPLQTHVCSDVLNVQAKPTPGTGPDLPNIPHGPYTQQLNLTVEYVGGVTAVSSMRPM